MCEYIIVLCMGLRAPQPFIRGIPPVQHLRVPTRSWCGACLSTNHVLVWVICLAEMV